MSRTNRDFENVWALKVHDIDSCFVFSDYFFTYMYAKNGTLCVIFTVNISLKNGL